MTLDRPQTPRPRAIAMPLGMPVVSRLAWALLGAMALLLSVGASAGRAVPVQFTAADAILPCSPEAAVERITRSAPAPKGELLEVHAVAHRATLRTSDRSRRTAGRAGISVRRDIGSASAVLPAIAGAPQVLEGGTAPFGAPAAARSPARGSHAHGVRGPPSISFVAG